MKRSITQKMFKYIDEKLSVNGAAQDAIVKKDARSVFVYAAEACVGIKESSYNKGVFVEEMQKTSDAVAGSESWCFPEYVEILTESGFVPFKDLKKNKKIAAVNEDGIVNFETPVDYIKKEYQGKGYRVETSNFSITCDEKHNFWGKFNNKKTNELRSLSSVTTCLSIPACETQNKDNKITDDELIFLAAFISDGFMSKTRQGVPRIKIQVSKKRKIALLDKMGFVGKSTASKTYGATKTPLTLYTFKIPAHFEDVFCSYKNLKWSFVNSLSKRQCDLFIKTYSQFDGSSIGTSLRVFSSRKELFDQLLAIATFAGYLSSVTFCNSKISGKPCWSFVFNPQKKTRTIKSKNIKKIELAETLYCVSVLSGRIVVRDGAAGAPVVVGNCMSAVQTFLAYVEKKLKVVSPVANSEHCLTVWRTTPKAQRVKKIPACGAIIIWQHGTSESGHTGVMTEWKIKKMDTVEGNTGDASFRDGDGVYVKERSTTKNGNMTVVGFLKPF